MMKQFFPIVLVLNLFALSCAPAEPGLEIEVLADIRDGGRLSSLLFEIRDIQVQPQGYEVTAETLVDNFDVCDAADGSVTIARGEIPAGRYDRIFLRPSSLLGTTQDGESVFIENVMEPTAFPLEVMEGQAHKLRLEVIVLESLDAAKKLSIFAKTVVEVN